MFLPYGEVEDIKMHFMRIASATLKNLNLANEDGMVKRYDWILKYYTVRREYITNK